MKIFKKNSHSVLYVGGFLILIVLTLLLDSDLPHALEEKYSTDTSYFLFPHAGTTSTILIEHRGNTSLQNFIALQNHFVL